MLIWFHCATWHFSSGGMHRSHPSRQNHNPTTHILLLEGSHCPFSFSLFSHSDPNGTLERETKGWFGCHHHTGNNPLSNFTLNYLSHFFSQVNYFCLFLFTIFIFRNCFFVLAVVVSHAGV